jgi:hypothetical protein
MNPDQEILLFHYQLGAAITQWTTVEEMLRRILIATFKNEEVNWEALSVGLFSLNGFSAKLDFVDGTVGRKIAGSPYARDWPSLVSKARTLSASRNKLAHWFIGKFMDCSSGRRIALTPLVYAKSTRQTKVARPPAGSLCVQDITKIKMEFLSLTYALENFLARASEQPEPHPKSAERPSSPPTVATQVRQIRAVLGVPQRPSRESPSKNHP